VTLRFGALPAGCESIDTKCALRSNPCRRRLSVRAFCPKSGELTVGTALARVFLDRNSHRGSVCTIARKESVMTSRQSRISLALSVALVLAITSCTKPKPPVGFTVKTVAITNCSAHPDPVTLYVQNGDQVQWTGDALGSYSLHFTDPSSPFAAGSDFTAPQNGSVSSGPISNSAAACANVSPSCPYKYTVAGSNGCSQDPKVIIQK
jgi:hypothetical protein